MGESQTIYILQILLITKISNNYPLVKWVFIYSNISRGKCSAMSSQCRPSKRVRKHLSVVVVWLLSHV